MVVSGFDLFGDLGPADNRIVKTAVLGRVGNTSDSICSTTNRVIFTISGSELVSYNRESFNLVSSIDIQGVVDLIYNIDENIIVVERIGDISKIYRYDENLDKKSEFTVNVRIDNIFIDDEYIYYAESTATYRSKIVKRRLSNFSLVATSAEINSSAYLQTLVSTSGDNTYIYMTKSFGALMKVRKDNLQIIAETGNLFSSGYIRKVIKFDNYLYVRRDQHIVDPTRIYNKRVDASTMSEDTPQNSLSCLQATNHEMYCYIERSVPNGNVWSVVATDRNYNPIRYSPPFTNSDQMLLRNMIFDKSKKNEIPTFLYVDELRIIQLTDMGGTL